MLFFKANFSGLSSRAQLVRARAAYTGRFRELKLKYRPKVPCEWPRATLMRFTFHVFGRKRGRRSCRRRLPRRSPLRAVSNRHDLFISKSPHERSGGAIRRRQRELLAEMLPNHPTAVTPSARDPKSPNKCCKLIWGIDARFASLFPTALSLTLQLRTAYSLLVAK